MIKYFLEKHVDPKIDLRLERKSAGASGYDLMANINCERDLLAGQRWNVSTGLYLEMPLGVEAQVRTRSGLARDHGVIVLNAPGTIDSDYRGEVQVTLINHGQSPFRIIPGERIAQLVFCPVYSHHSREERRTELVDYLSAHHWSGISFVQMLRVTSRDELNHTDRGASGFGSTGR